MRKIILSILISLVLNTLDAQNNAFDFSNAWEQVADLESQQRSKDALNKIKEIEKNAIKEKQSEQQVKCLIYKAKFNQFLEENSEVQLVNDFNKSIAANTKETKYVLQNYLAQYYWNYLQNNSWEIRNRTESEISLDENDFRTWTYIKLRNEIHRLFQESIADEQTLQAISVGDLTEILELADYSDSYRPYLYDILVHHAIEFYTQEDKTNTDPVNLYVLKNDLYLSDFESFCQIKIEEPTVFDSKYYALSLYQKRMQIHQKSDKSILIDVDILRLYYVKDNLKTTDVNALYLQTLEKSIALLEDNENYVYYAYEKALHFYALGESYTPENKKNQFKKKESLDILNTIKEIAQRNDPSFLYQKVLALKSNITKPTFSAKLEKHIPTKYNAKFLLNYQNLDSIQVEIYPYAIEVYESSFTQIHQSHELLTHLDTIQPIYASNEKLITENDCQHHSIELALPKLKKGHYVLLLKNAHYDDALILESFAVTDLSFINRKSESGTKFTLLDRKSGKAKTNLAVAFNYISQSNQYNDEIQNKFTKEHYTSDPKGEFVVKSTTEYFYNSYFLISDKQTPILFPVDYFHNAYATNEGVAVRKEVSFFTDRAIYRPGQTVYFKGIMASVEENKSTVLANEKGKVLLRDVNWQEKSSVEVQSNEFGSFSGSFVLPLNGLTGSYSIYYDGGNQINQNGYYIQVEEYKGPKFEVTFESIAKTYEVNEKVTIVGNALAYAGSTITDAKVSYKITRTPIYPAWCWWRGFAQSEQEIGFGETKTDAKGRFSIDFLAQPDLDIDPKDLPKFNYQVSADVTDINGETRSNTTSVTVAYHAIEATILYDRYWEQSNKNSKTLVVQTLNLNGVFAAVESNIKIYKLEAPKQVVRERPWAAPEYKKWSKEDFNKKFPYEEYECENQEDKWALGAIVFEENFNSGSKSLFDFTTQIADWKTGKYKIVLTCKDSKNKEVKSENILVLNNDLNKKIERNSILYYSTDKSEHQVGEVVKITWATGAKKLLLKYSIEKKGKIIKEETLALTQKKQTIEIPVEAGDLGGFVINYTYNYQNTAFANTIYVIVPYPSHELSIQTTTFRDKLSPNSSEKWSFKIKNPDSTGAMAELLANMYDLSLDQFATHNYIYNPWSQPQYYVKSAYDAFTFDIAQQSVFDFDGGTRYGETDYEYGNLYRTYSQLNWFGYTQYYARHRMMRGAEPMVWDLNPVYAVEESDGASDGEMTKSKTALTLAKSNTSAYALSTEKPGEEKKIDLNTIQARKNLKETAFFYPQLRTNAQGEVSFEFTTPEALTKWKIMLLAHTKNLHIGQQTLTAVTQKELMVTPNFPRFVREGDTIKVSCKIANLTEKPMNGKVQLFLTDIVSQQSIASKLIQGDENQLFGIDAKGNTVATWVLQIPMGLQGIEYKIVAQAGEFTDGEQNFVPVLSNRMLVTETLPIWIKSGETKTFVLDKLKNNKSTTLTNHQLSLEMTSNPAWYAVQALPYLMEYPYECAEQTFSRYYANRLAQHIVQSNPQIKKVFDQWASSDALISNLEKNQELKMLLIQETPWLRDAQSETEQQKRIALLFDLNQMSNNLDMAFAKLQEMQSENGSWAWFKGGYANRYMTQYIVSGFGHLKQLNVPAEPKVTALVAKAMPYLTQEFEKEYQDLIKYKADLTKNQLSSMQLHYVYLISNYPEFEPKESVAYKFYIAQIQKYWRDLGLYEKSLAAIVMKRKGDAKTANAIITALKQNSIVSEELGMYWKTNTNGYYWHQNSIETQAIIIEAFSVCTEDTKSIDMLKQWLLKNKQTNRWESTKATSEAVYALLLRGTDWISIDNKTQVTLGTTKIIPTQTQAGTGYYKISWKGAEIKPEYATATVSQQGEGIAWGALYWQYFENMDKITSAKTPLSLEKKLYKKINSNTGEQLIAITDSTKLEVGDLIRVVTLLKTDRDMEFVHLKDMRASCFEPIDVLSSYKWQGGIGYYQSTKDASTNFFIDYLAKGQYLFEYDVRVNNAGAFSNGISSIQCMYAPEFTSHSQGVRVYVR